MSKLNDLIKELCPDGVEYKKLGSFTKILRGKRLTKNLLSDEYEFCVYHGGLEPLGKFKNYNRNENTVMIINVGASAGTIGFCKEKFWSSDGCFCVENNDSFSSRYLYYYLSNNENYFQSKVRKAGIPTLDASVVENYIIPLPPLPVQCEIVRILDNFTALTAELTAELTARQKQYEYYRDALLTFAGGQNTSSVRWLKLCDIAVKISSGGTPLKSHSEYYDGDIPWLRTQEVDWNYITDTAIKISEDGLHNSSAKWIPANCVIIAMYGATAGKAAINRIPITTNQACCNLEIDNSKALYRYVYHWIKKSYLVLKSLGQGSQNNINGEIIKQFTIPIPSLEEQQRIVDILDRFDKLCNNLSEGLPAEIAARQKQYEYYRDKLLTFKEKEA